MDFKIAALVNEPLSKARLFGSVTKIILGFDTPRLKARGFLAQYL